MNSIGRLSSFILKLLHLSEKHYFKGHFELILDKDYEDIEKYSYMPMRMINIISQLSYPPQVSHVLNWLPADMHWLCTFN